MLKNPTDWGKIMKIISLIFLLIIGQVAHAESGCPEFYPLGQPITVANGIELCNTFYVVQFANNRAVFSAEKFRYGNHPERSNDFHPDARLPAKNRASNADYRLTGYDKGHLTPAADATNDAEMHDTFLLSNMTPQEKTVNEQSWRLLEIKVRNLKPDYVITGAIYPKNPKTIGPHKVPVPSGYYKATYAEGTIRVWYADNVVHAQVTPIGIRNLEQLTGLQFPRYKGLKDAN